MQTPVNTFKQALARGEAQIGLWLGLADPYCAELCAGAGFDWLVIDAEHAPNDVRNVLAQLQAVAPYPVHPVVRPPVGDPVLIKQYLDIGVTTLLVPMVEDAEQAAALVRATRYPPEGIRGVGSSLARASRWNRYPHYLAEANDQVCLLVQIETVSALTRLEDIARVPGVDGVFIGPADLSASMGHLGNPGHPDVQAAVTQALKDIQACGKAAGILTADETLARQYLDLGASFVAVGVDTSLLAKATQALAARFKGGPAPAAPQRGSVY